MALTLPDLDDRDFDRLVRDAVALSPRHFPAWTDHNESDPGITLVQLFAFLTEAAIYHLNRIPERSLEHFAALVGVARCDGEAIVDTLRRAFEAVRARERVVLAEEFSGVVLAALPELARAHAAVRMVEGGLFPDETVMEMTVLPVAPGEPAPLPPPELLSQVFALLDGRRLITTRVEIVPPAYRAVVVEAEIEAAAGVLDPAALRARVEDTIRAFLHPLTGGIEGTGWPFGRPLYRSELFRLLEGMDGVDHVTRLQLGTQDGAPPEEVDRIDALSPTALMRLAGLRVSVRSA
jgi:hypothetical protein